MSVTGDTTYMLPGQTRIDLAIRQYGLHRVFVLDDGGEFFDVDEI